jgi:lysophospholipase L1-like esterase
MIQKILAIGDCNTLGADQLGVKSFPERLGALIGAEVINLGHTMATTREGVNILRDSSLDDVDCVFIQFGLVDSYKTFKFSPYILYFPDNFLRKQIRSVVKKYKKICRKIGLNKYLGEINVVPIDEYEDNIRRMIEQAIPRTVVLIDTIPSKRLELNDEIRRYNNKLTSICQQYPNCLKVDLEVFFEQNLENYYLDQTHCNAVGCDFIAQKIREALETSK